MPYPCVIALKQAARRAPRETEEPAEAGRGGEKEQQRSADVGNGTNSRGLGAQAAPRDQSERRATTQGDARPVKRRSRGGLPEARERGEACGGNVRRTKPHGERRRSGAPVEDDKAER